MEGRFGRHIFRACRASVEGGAATRSGRLLLWPKTGMYRLMDSDSQSGAIRRIAIRLSIHSWGQTMKGEA